MSYIGYSQTEILLKKYPLLKSLLANLQIELRKFWETGQSDTLNEEDIMYSLSIGNKVLSDMPHAGSRAPGDKELGIILTKDRIIEEGLRDLVTAINTIGEVVEKIDNAMSGLNPQERQIIELRHFTDLPWKAILREIGYLIEERQAKRIRREAIEKMVKVLRITPEQFDFCMGEIQEVPKEREEESN